MREDKRPGENALERTRRLLKQVNDRFADPGQPEIRFIDLKLTPAGDGCFHYPTGEVVFEFDALDEMTTFLEGSTADQVRAIAGQ